MKKVEETIVIRNEKMIYAVRLKSKTEGEDGRRENNNPYLIVEGGKIKYIDHIYGNKSEFNFNDEVHTVAKEIFISGLKNAIKEEILQLKQLELVLEEMNLKECIGDTLQESATFLQNVRKFIGVGEKYVNANNGSGNANWNIGGVLLNACNGKYELLHTI